MRSSASVVTPGATALPASASALAAIRPATRIFLITSGVCTHGSVPSRAVGFPTYFRRGVDLGTRRVGDSTPAESAERTGMLPGYLLPAATMQAVDPAGSSTAMAAQQRPARPFDMHRAAHHPTGQHHMRCPVGRRVLPPVAGATAKHLDIVDRGARALGQPDLHRPAPHVEFNDDHRSR